MKKWITMLGIGLAGLAFAEPTSAASRPNIVMVLIDDMGWADLACFGNGQAATPSIDRLASEGIVFEQFYVNSPICSPSRVAITTGQYPQRWHITSYLDNARKNAHRGMANWLNPEAPVFARMLQEAGYATGHFGKWHMGGQRDVDVAPPISAYGFDESLTNFEGMGPKLLPLTLEPGWDKPKKIWADAERLGGPYTWTMRCEITSGFVDAAIDFMKRADKKEQPFFINVWPDDVHGPWVPSLKNWEEDIPGLYLSVLKEMDEQLAALFDYVRRNPKLRENTLVVFCSDNGADPKTFDPSTKPLRGSKATLYEGGVRSPLIVWGPGLQNGKRAGTRNQNAVVGAMDLAPSLLGLAGVQPPKTVRFDGENMIATLLGRESRSRSTPIYFSRPPDFKKAFGAEQNLPDLAVRKDQWKLLCNDDGSAPQLYDLLEDPKERNSLTRTHPEVAAELTRQLLDWHQSMH